MSLTASIGAVGPSHWTYMAAVLAEKLSRIITSKQLKRNDIPGSAKRDAQKFFQLALIGGSKLIAENPSASINAFVIASDVLRMCERSLLTGDQVMTFLQTFDDFFSQLDSPRPLTSQEIATAEQLRRFFLQLQEEGEAELYAESIHGGEQPYGFPFFDEG